MVVALPTINTALNYVNDKLVDNETDGVRSNFAKQAEIVFWYFVFSYMFCS